MDYAELFCQSHFSFLSAAASPEQLVGTADSLGYQALALTDECSVAGVVRAHRQIKQQQLKIRLIVGSYFCLLYTSPSPRDGLLSRMPSSA